jgi:predicted nucleotidyltransferase component of viral defense system
MQFGKGKKADPILIEKVTRSLYLLESLAETDLPFVFKGGTALLILLGELHRFSIDVDITIPKNTCQSRLSKILDSIVQSNPVFTRFEENHRGHNTLIQKTHYKIYYISSLNKEEAYVLLDVLNETNQYSEIVEKDINCELVDTSHPFVKVNMPSIDSILGDKLTAFAPNTCGIPYGKNKELEIVKQLFDVANLFDRMNNVQTVSSTFKKISVQELSYRKIQDKYTFFDVLDDTFNTSKIIAARGKIEKATFESLLEGIKRIRSFVFSKNYRLEHAVNDASKAAYLSLLIKHNIPCIKRYNSSIDLTQLKMKTEYKKLFGTIIKFDPEAYYYLYCCSEIMLKN